MTAGARTPFVRVVAGMVLRSGRVLLAQRGPQMDLAGCWEFPGGKVEAGESPPEALRRELDEELGIHVEVGTFLAESRLSQPERVIILEGWTATLVNGEPEAREHAALRWQEPTAIDRDTLAPADLPLLDALIAHVTTNSHAARAEAASMEHPAP